MRCTASRASPRAAARLVAAMEHVDRVVNAFVEDIGRAVAQVRAEVAAERDVSLSSIARAQNQLDDAYQTLQAEKAWTSRPTASP